MSVDEDIWGQVMFDASFGGMRLDVVSTSDSAGRSLVRHRYPHRDGADVEDTGGEERVTRCQVVFFERPPQPGEVAETHLERFIRFRALVAQGKSQVFVHPLTGSYNAKVEEFSFEAAAESRDMIRVSCSFVEDTTEPAVYKPGAGTPVLAGAAEVDVEATTVTEQAEALLEEDEAEDFADVSSAAVASAVSWETDAATTARQVNVGLTDTANEIDRLVDEYDLVTDVSRYPLFTALVRLRSAMQKAARAFTQRSPRFIEIRVPSPMPLLVVASRTYGAAEAQERSDELARLNDVRNPARIERGTVLRGQAPGGRVFLRSPR